MPADTVSINLSRALKLKNRVVSRLSQLETLIVTYNSATEDTREYDVRELYDTRRAITAKLVALKTAVNAANQPVQHLIYELAENKALIVMLGKVGTKHGPMVEGFSGTKVTYVAQFRKPEIDREIRRLEQEIDRIQDELDRFNHQTTITIDASLLAETEAT